MYGRKERAERETYIKSVNVTFLNFGKALIRNRQIYIKYTEFFTVIIIY